MSGGETKCVFFGNLPYGLSLQAGLVEEIESRVGRGSVFEVRASPHGDYAHVDFETSEQTAAAVREMQGTPVKGRPLRVDLA